ncbi:hypothetical protein Dimus_009175 [Dionaea muscipula]
MAPATLTSPTLTSPSFLLPTPPHSRSSPNHRRLTVSAKRLGPGTGPFPSFFQPRKSADAGDSSPEEIRDGVGAAPSSNPLGLLFNLGKLPEARALVPVVGISPAKLSSRRKDPDTVFVAGATGVVGIRLVRSLLRQGFKVRAGVPDLDAAQELARFASAYKIISSDESRLLNAVESTFEDAESIAKAIGNASKVVVTIGPSEDGPDDEVTTLDALQVVEAAQLAGASHVSIIYDDSTPTGFGYNKVFDGISSFFNNLFSKRQPVSVSDFLQKVVETNVRYTFIRTRLSDDAVPESSYNLVVAAEGSTGSNDYKVSLSQMASLVADLFSNTEVAENKVVEIYTDPSAPSRPFNELFSAIPEDGRRKAYAEALAKTKAEEEAIKASEMAREAAEAAKELEEEVKKLSEQEALAASLAEEAKQKAEAAGISVENLLNKAKGIGSGISFEKLSSRLATAVPKPTIKAPKVQIATVRGQAKARSLPSQRAVVKQSTPKVPRSSEGEKHELKQKDTKRVEPTTIAEVTKGAAPKANVSNIFWGLFKQETIYVDDD